MSMATPRPRQAAVNLAAGFSRGLPGVRPQGQRSFARLHADLGNIAAEKAKCPLIAADRILSVFGP
jgi:hypothetical protein